MAIGSASVLLIIALSLWRSRRKLSMLQAENRRALEKKVNERTRKLREINNRLYDVINAHEQTRNRLSESEAYSQSILESMPSLLIGVDRDLIVTRWNKAAEHFKGVSTAQAIGARLADLFPDLPFATNLITTAITTGQAKSIDTVNIYRAGQHWYLSVMIYPIEAGTATGAVIRLDDITRRVRLENMLVQDEKLLSMGRMAAGLAHEINNPLAGITQAAQSIERRLLQSLEGNETVAREHGTNFATIRTYVLERDIDELIESIRESSERAAQTVKTMLDFSHKSELEHEVFELEPLIQKCIKLARQEFPPGVRGIEIPVLSNDKHPLMAEAAINEIQQVVVNLLSNAADALDQAHSDGKLDTPELRIELHRQSPLLLIDIVDNGEGIPTAVRDQIFEPFYTTKEVGRGTGLGLSISYFIMTEHHRGALELLKRDGPGCTFRASLPEHHAAADDDQRTG